MIMLPGGIYNWEKQQYYYLLADESSATSPDGLTFNYCQPYFPLLLPLLRKLLFSSTWYNS